MNTNYHEPTTKQMAIVVAICFGFPILASIDAVLHGFAATQFNDSILYSTIIMELILGAFALAYLQGCKYRIKDLIPNISPIKTGMGLVLCLCALLISKLVQLMAGDEIQPVDLMVSNSQLSFVPMVLASIINGCYEEIFLLGFLQRAFRNQGALFAIGISCLVRMSYHLYQGPVGAIEVLIVGILFGSYYYWSGALWSIILAHIIIDVTAFTFN